MIEILFWALIAAGVYMLTMAVMYHRSSGAYMRAHRALISDELDEYERWRAIADRRSAIAMRWDPFA